MHVHWAILRGADIRESWHEAAIWVMPNGTTSGDLDTYRAIALRQHNMRMLMAPLMRRFRVVVVRKRMALDWQFGAMLGSTLVASMCLSGLQRCLEENHVLALDISKAFDTAPLGSLGLLVRHMGDTDELIKLFHTISCGSTVRIVIAYCPTWSIRLHRGLRQGGTVSLVLYLLLLEPLLRGLATKAQGDTCYTVPPLV